MFNMDVINQHKSTLMLSVARKWIWNRSSLICFQKNLAYFLAGVWLHFIDVLKQWFRDGSFWKALDLKAWRFVFPPNNMGGNVSVYTFLSSSEKERAGKLPVGLLSLIEEPQESERPWLPTAPVPKLVDPGEQQGARGSKQRNRKLAVILFLLEMPLQLHT